MLGLIRFLKKNDAMWCFRDASSGGQGISAVGASLPPTGQSSGAAAILGQF